MTKNSMISLPVDCSIKATAYSGNNKLETPKNKASKGLTKLNKKSTSLVSSKGKNKTKSSDWKALRNIDITKTCWKKMGIIQQLVAIGAYLNTNSDYKAFTLRLSYEKMELLEKQSKPADYLRRRICSAYRKKFKNKIPVFGFILEKSRKGHLHLHGIIDLTNFPKRKARNLLKQCAFGANFRELSMHRYMLKVREIFEGKGWLAYMAKNPELVKPYVYMANQIKRETKKFLMEIKNEK